jgi:hypothetical protein
MSLMPSVTNTPFKLSIIMLNVVMLGILLNVVAPKLGTVLVKQVDFGKGGG